jgi:septal ring-binding cell division protein DamX
VAHTQDEGFHEIQLSGKQLAFLVMAATVVSVVIFLFGVLVGRGVRTERTMLETASASGVVDPPPAAAGGPRVDSPPEDPTKAAEAPAPASESLSYAERLEKHSPPSEQLKPGSDKKSDKAEKAATAAKPPARTAATSAGASAPPSTASSGAPASPAAEAHTAAEPAGAGFAVQIAALNVRSEADAIAKRLSAKGYSAYVLAPASGSPSVFRVRVGKFQTRREAESVAAKLQKEEQFKPWVTR